MLTVENLRFSYVPGQDIMKDVTFTIGNGEFITLGGRNGCGKTTVTRLLVGLETPVEGKIFYDSQDITNMPTSERGRFIGYVFQQPDRQMFRQTVAEEVAFGPEQLGYDKATVDRIVQDALERVGISHLAESYPLGLRRGEKQRVAIASALAMQSKLLILDEPTSGQDGTETKGLLVLLQELITHDMEIMAEYSTRVIIMGYGTKAFDGSPEELFTHREDLLELGLTKPPSVVLSETVPALGYCKSMKEFELRYAEYVKG